MARQDGRCVKKVRRAERELILDALSDIAESEVGDDDDDEFQEITEEDLAQVERDGLIDDENFDVFIMWLQFGGEQRGLSPMEIIAMPASMVKDFIYLMSQLNKKKKRFRKTKEKKKKTT